MRSLDGMSTLRSWDDLNAGVGCPLCAPRPDNSEFHDLVRKLSVSTLYLVKEQAYRGTCGLVFDRRHVTRLDQLTPEEWGAFSLDLARAEAAVFATVAPDHINVECLGMTVPHLHWHIIPRYRSDPRWGGPIWTTERSDMASVRLSEAEQRALAEHIGRSIDRAV
jgi:diadenosine tetraphosphate (Ap4A) HIT family hydrolase